jgi:hypothetical protein
MHMSQAKVNAPDPELFRDVEHMQEGERTRCNAVCKGRGGVMKSRNLFPLLAMVLLAAGSLYAQIANPVKANVPFDFTAGNITLPAGEYQVGSTEHPGTLLIRGESTQGSFLGSFAAQANGRAAISKLVFHRYGDRYFLYQIWVQGEDRGSELPMAKVEKELRASARPSSLTILARR